MTTGPNEYAERASRAFNRRAFLTGTFAAPLVLPGRVIPSLGRHITVHYAAHFTFRDGLAIREEAFFDSAVLMPLAEQGEG